MVAIGAIVIGFSGRSEVSTNLQREAIVGTPDMTPAAIAKEAKAGQSVDTGDEAKCFAS